MATCDDVFSVMNKMCDQQLPSPHYLPVLGAQSSVRCLQGEREETGKLLLAAGPQFGRAKESCVD